MNRPEEFTFPMPDSSQLESITIRRARNRDLKEAARIARIKKSQDVDEELLRIVVTKVNDQPVDPMQLDFNDWPLPDYQSLTFFYQQVNEVPTEVLNSCAATGMAMESDPIAEDETPKSEAG